MIPLPGHLKHKVRSPASLKEGVRSSRLLGERRADFQDWLLLISPQMGDLTTSSQDRWNEAVQTAKELYDSHQGMEPIEKLKHDIEPNTFLQQRLWARLEKRASNLLLLALPESQKEDIISTKSVTVLNILSRLMQNYQPGGAHETRVRQGMWPTSSRRFGSGSDGRRGRPISMWRFQTQPPF